MNSTESGMVTEVNDEQKQKASAPIVMRDEPKVTDSSPAQ